MVQPQDGEVLHILTPKTCTKIAIIQNMGPLGYTGIQCQTDRAQKLEKALQRRKEKLSPDQRVPRLTFLEISWVGPWDI